MSRQEAGMKALQGKERREHESLKKGGMASEGQSPWHECHEMKDTASQPRAEEGLRGPPEVECEEGFTADSEGGELPTIAHASPSAVPGVGSPDAFTSSSVGNLPNTTPSDPIAPRGSLCRARPMNTRWRSACHPTQVQMKAS